MSARRDGDRRELRPARRARSVGLGAALFAGAVLATGCARPESPRHLLVICLDTVRTDHLGAYGYERQTTPTIDALAERGTLFRRAWSTSNWTVPATASLMTSLPPAAHGAVVPGETKHLGEGSPPLQMDESALTLADVLAPRGVATALVSANPYLYGRFQRGFDHVVVRWRPAGEMVDEALRWLEGLDRRPFYLHLQLMDAHQPNRPPRPYYDLFPAPGAGPREPRHEDWSYGQVTGQEGGDFRAFAAHRTALYDGSLRYVDEQIGRLLAALAARELLDETLVVITADHGEELWDHAVEQSRWGDDPRGLWGIGHGHTMFEELVRVPLIFAGGRWPAGERLDCPASLLDVAPTVLAALGVPAPEAMAGIDLGAVAAAGTPCPERGLVATSPAYGPDAASLMLWPLKLVRRGGNHRLYDLAADPGERSDLAPRRREETRILARRLARAETDGPGAAGADAADVDAETREQLRALGYH